MLIVLGIYLTLVWLVFSRLKLVKWGWASGTATILICALILAVFLAMFNSMTPSGSLTVVSRVVEVTPNVSGQVVSIPVKTNVPIKAGSVLFQIDKSPFQAKVKQLEAALAQAQQQAKQLQSNYNQATATVAGLTAQLAYNRQRLADIQKLSVQQVQSAFREQDTRAQFEITKYQLEAAKAAQATAKLAMESEIDGVNTAVAQTQAQLEYAKWELDQTTVLAPSDGVVTIMALAVGDRALQARSVMSFIVSDDVTLIGFFQPNGFQTIKPGATVKIVLDSFPGRIFRSTILDIPQGVGQGPDRRRRYTSARRLGRRCKSLPRADFGSGRLGSSAIEAWHAGHRDGLRAQRRRDWLSHVHSRVDQLVYGLSLAKVASRLKVA